MVSDAYQIYQDSGRPLSKFCNVQSLGYTPETNVLLYVTCNKNNKIMKDEIMKKKKKPHSLFNEEARHKNDNSE